MKLERKKNTIRNIEAGLINKIITIVCPFILRTILINILGTEYLGLSSLFTSILQVLSLSEMGIGSAMVFSLYQPISEDDTNRIRELVSLYQVIYRRIGIFIFSAGLLVLPFLPYLIHGSIPADVNLYVLYLLYLANSSESYFLSAYKSTILSAHQRRDIISNIGLITHILLYVIQISCLIGFKKYYMYVIWLPIFTAVENMATAIYVNRHFKEYIIKVKYSKKDLSVLLTKVKDLFGHKLSQVVTNSVDTIVISSFLGLQMVTLYNNYFYLMSAVAGILDILYQGVLAGIGNSLFSESKKKNKKDFLKFTIINSWIIGWCSICFLCLYQPMMKIWMGDELMLSFNTVVLMSIYFYVWKIRQTVLIYKDAAGMWDIDRGRPYIEIAVNLIVNIILVQLIGINGIVISTIISMVSISIPWETNAFFKAYFKSGLVEYTKLILQYLIYTFIAALCTYMICNTVPEIGITGFVIRIIVCIIVPNLIILIIGSSNIQHKEVIKFALSLMRIK